MSAKCKDFNEFYPLLIDKYNSDVTLNKEEFKNFLNEYFIDPEKVYSEFLSGIDSATQTPEYSIREISSRTGQEKVTEINTPQQAYIGKPSEYNKMKDTFIKDMVGLSIYDLNKNQVIVNNPVGDTDVLNNNIFNYKVKLLNTISKFLKDTTVIEDTDTTDIIEQKFEDVLTKFENVMYSNIDPTNEYKDAYNAFIILKFFDALLDITTKFIAIRLEYKKSSKYSKYRYIYKGPEVKQFTSVFDPNEFMDASDSFSDLSKILLNYFPEIDSRGQVIQYTSIGENAFKSITNKLLSWAKNSTNPTVKAELKKQTQADWSKLIDIYKQDLSKNLINNPEHIIRELYKLNAIQKYLFNPETNESIRFMFIHYMNKTVQSSYVSYSFDSNTKRIASKNLTERPIKMQATFLDDVVKGATIYWKQLKNKYDDILKKYDITVSNNGIKIGNAVILQDQFGRYSTNSPIENLDSIINELGSLLIEDNFEDVANSIYRNRKSKQQLYLPFIATIIHNVSNNDNKVINFGQKQDLARVLGVINGSDVISVIKNSEGNNLPLYQMLCLVYRHIDIHDRIEKEINDNLDKGSIYNDNLVYLNIDKIASPKIRTEVSLFGKTTSSADLNSADCMHLAMVYDFYQQLVTKQSSNENQGAISGVVGFQTHVYSDKNKHFIMQFDLNKPWDFYDESINFKDLLTQYLETADKTHLKPILDIWFRSNQRQINTAVNEIIRDYNKALGTNFTSLEEIKTLLANSNIDEIRHKFFENKIAFIEEIHASKSGINETLEYLHEIFNDKTKFNQFVKKQLNLFIGEIQSAWNTIKYDDNLIYSLQNTIPQFVNKTTSKDGVVTEEVLMYDKDNNINPLVLSYFIMDSFLSNEYNKMMIGNVYNHANKMPKNAVETVSKAILERNGWEQDKLTKEQQEQFNEQLKEDLAQYSISNRWIAQIKRMVIYGATYHSYAQGLKKGVPRTVKMACISDIEAKVFNMIGQNDKVDSMDGSGLTSPYLSRWQNVSLIDAAVGENKKTIYHDIGGQHGNSTLLKWAEYALTNNIRRKHGAVNGDIIFKKMHSLEFSNNIQYHKDFENLYFRDKNTGKYYRILSITIDGQKASRVLHEYTKDGRPVGSAFTDTLNNMTINTIYNIDALFGGAWVMQYNDLAKNLQYSEVQNDYVNDIICDNNLKEYLIGWLVNKSAVKVGQANLNDKSVWTNSDNLMYTTMSTEFGGLQMDADHDLDEAEVTEASQMISALEQNGYTHDIAMAAYNEIGKFCFDAIADIQKNISENDKEALYNIFGKAVIKAFATGEKDTLGLAQTFVKLAQESMKDNKLQYQIPFSSSSINGIFNSTVTSSLVKDTIRRHYDGVPAVLNPSYNMVQFFNIGGNNYSYEELIDLVAERTKGTAFEGISVDQLMETPRIQVGDGFVWSPFTEAITPGNPVDVEDTIIVVNPDNTYQTIKIDNYIKYSFYRNYCKQPIYRWTIKGRNLKGSDTVFTIGDRKYSAYESSYNQLLTFINSSQINTPEQVKAYLKENLAIANEEDIDSFTNVVVDSFKNEALSYLVNKGVTLPTDTQIINWTYDKQSNQFLLNTNTSNQVFYVSNNIFKKELVNKQQKLLENIADNREFNWYGQTAIATNVNVIPAQIIMGKLYAKKLGLLPGDTIAHIKSQGWEFFKGRMMRNHLSTNSNENSYDWLLTDGNGNKLYVKLRDNSCAQILESASNMSDYLSVDGKIYYKGKELCSSDGKEFFTYNDGSEEHNLVIVDDIDRFREIVNTNLFTNTQRNYQLRNYVPLIKEKYNENSIQIPVKVRGKIIYKNIAEFETTEELLSALKQNEQYVFNRQIEKLAKDKYLAFEKSLLFIGTRIPCQSMQSFAPMEVVMFDDTDTNQVYISPTITWLQGSDYDIDKQYIMGYTISDNGSLTTTDKGYLKEDGLKNRVVDKIMEVIRNPKNQINLTQPITTDRIREIADRSLAGAASRTYGPFRPSCRYMMQIENMVGKKVIGNVATAIKSFFALSNVYNEQFKAIKNYLLENNYDKARELLNRYTFKYRKKRITLANVNVEGFIPLINNTDIPEDIRITLANIIEFQSSLDDQSMLLGELLNSATDERYKQKIMK